MPGFLVGVQSASVVALLQRRTIIAIVTVVRARTTARAVAASIPAAAVRTITRRSAAQRWTVRILLLLNLWRFSSTARRAFTVSNSDVSRTYSGFDGRIFAISVCDFSMRSGVGGWVEKAFASVPGFFFSFAS